MSYTRLLSGGARRAKGLLYGRHSPAAATAAVVTIAAKTNGTIIIHKIISSYSADPTGGSIKIESPSGTIIFEQSITRGGPATFNLTRVGAESQAVIVTLASGAGAVVGKLDVDYEMDGQ